MLVVFGDEQGPDNDDDSIRPSVVLARPRVAVAVVVVDDLLGSSRSSMRSRMAETVLVVVVLTTRTLLHLCFLVNIFQQVPSCVVGAARSSSSMVSTTTVVFAVC